MMWFRKSLKSWTHEKLPQSEDEADAQITGLKRHSRREFYSCITLFNILLTTLTITVALLPREPRDGPELSKPVEQACTCDDSIPDRRYKNPKLNPDLKRVSGYSPLLDEVDLTPQPTVLNGAFHDNKTIYMQDPSPEVDEAWELFSGDIFLTTYPTVRDAGRSLSKSIHFPPSPDGEAGKYLATWDVFHQIHCLNWLRKATNWEYYYGDHKPGPVYATHQKHCIHMILQSLMCNADVDMITFEWMEGHDARVNDLVGEDDKNESHDHGSPFERRAHANQAAIPAANFHVHKMCRNFSALVEWAKKNKEDDPTETRRKLTVPDDVQLSRWEDY